MGGVLVNDSVQISYKYSGYKYHGKTGTVESTLPDNQVKVRFGDDSTLIIDEQYLIKPITVEDLGVEGAGAADGDDGRSGLKPDPSI